MAADGNGVNCDKAEEIGAIIQKKLDNVCVLNASIKTSEQILPLEHLYPGIKVDKQQVHINPGLLFSRLIALVQREEDMTPYFDYELTPIPTSLFKDNTMRKPSKAQLAKALIDDVQLSKPGIELMHVLDGGIPFHKVKWAKKATYRDKANHYVKNTYGSSCIVFSLLRARSINKRPRASKRNWESMCRHPAP